MQGAYFYEALSVALANMFSKGTRHEYPKEPYIVNARDEKEKQIANEEILKESIMAMAEKMKEKQNDY